MSLAAEAALLLSEAQSFEQAINEADPDQVTARDLQEVLEVCWQLRGIIAYIEDRAESGLRRQSP